MLITAIRKVTIKIYISCKLVILDSDNEGESQVVSKWIIDGDYVLKKKDVRKEVECEKIQDYIRSFEE